MLTPASSYEDVYGGFRWQIPSSYNIGYYVCDRHARDPTQRGLIYEDAAGRIQEYTFLEIMRRANRLANALIARGLCRGDRVGILLAQSLETVIAHVATYKMGAIAVPLSTLFGADALEYRLENSGARALITDRENLTKIEMIRDRLPDLAVIVGTDVAKGHPEAGLLAWAATLDAASDRFEAAPTGPDDPALIIYTSGTTGPPKGALRAHRVLLGHLPGVEWPHEFFPQPGDLFWTPAYSASIGGLIDVLLPAWHHGVPVLAHSMRKFEPEQAFGPMARHGVRNVFMPPTALKLMREVGGAPGERSCRLRTLASGGETLGGAARLGTRELRPDHQRVLRPDRMQSRGRQLRRRTAGPPRLHGVARSLGTASRSQAMTARSCQPARSATSRSGARIRSCSSSTVAILRRRAPNSRVTCCSQGISPARTMTVICGSSAARTTWSLRPATGSAQARSKNA
jgi:acetyl-CoA synthetase